MFYKNHIENKLTQINVGQPYDGTIVTGEVGDIVWSYLDRAVLSDPDFVKYLYRPWQEFFALKNNNADFFIYGAYIVKVFPKLVA